jgi:hypothetical protein
MELTSEDLFAFLERKNACGKALNWVEHTQIHKSPRQIWKACENRIWLEWVVDDALDACCMSDRTLWHESLLGSESANETNAPGCGRNICSFSIEEPDHCKHEAEAYRKEVSWKLVKKAIIKDIEDHNREKMIDEQTLRHHTQ